MLDRSEEEKKSSFEDRLARARADQKGAGGPEGKSRGRGVLGVGLRMSTELVSAVLVGGLVGWALDRWLGTTPWLLILFFLLGTAAGMRNILRAAAELDRQAALDAEEEDPKS